MSQTQSDLRYIRFASFLADLRTGELRRNGVRLKLSGQPFQILAILLERPGELVTREELQNRVWPDTIVDVERSLNTAINKVREVLGDVSGRPRFIETLPRRGYRFIAAVETESSADPDALEEPEKPSALPMETIPKSIEQPSAQTELKSKKPHRAAFVWVPILSFVVIVIAAVWYLLRPLPEPRIIAHRQITHNGRPKRLVGTDGARLYFNEDLGMVAQVPVSGGESSRIPIPLEHVTALSDVTSDGSNLLIVTHQNGYHPDGQLWVLGIFGGALHRLPDGLWGAFSPDGNFVAYSTYADHAIWIVRSDGTGARKLAPIEPTLSRSLAWSPDGSRIRAFARDGRLWEMSTDGSNRHVVQIGWPPFRFRCCGRWTPDGEFFLFLNGTTAGYYAQPEIWALDERHRLFRKTPSDPIQLTFGPMEWGWPTSSPDGKTIYADALTTRGELSRLDVKSGQSQPYLGGISAQGVSFSPDGRSIAYVSLPEGVLWKSDRDGANPVQLTPPGMDVYLPRWSPDSTQIVFYDSINSPHIPHMYVVSTAGGAPRRLIPSDESPERDPDWSPDGTRIVFGSPTEPSNPRPFEDWTLRILELKDNRLTEVPGAKNTYSPRWSPDGRYIAGLSGDSLELKIFDTHTKRWLGIRAKEDFAFPQWSSDSRWIYFTRPYAPPTAGPTGLFRVRPTGGEIERVVDLTQFHIIGWFSTWFTLDPTGAPLIVQDLGTHDLYGLTWEIK